MKCFMFLLGNPSTYNGICLLIVHTAFVNLIKDWSEGLFNTFFITYNTMSEDAGLHQVQPNQSCKWLYS